MIWVQYPSMRGVERVGKEEMMMAVLYRMSILIYHHHMVIRGESHVFRVGDNDRALWGHVRISEDIKLGNQWKEVMVWADFDGDQPRPYNLHIYQHQLPNERVSKNKEIVLNRVHRAVETALMMATVLRNRVVANGDLVVLIPKYSDQVNQLNYINDPLICLSKVTHSDWWQCSTQSVIVW